MLNLLFFFSCPFILTFKVFKKCFSFSRGEGNKYLAVAVYLGSNCHLVAWISSDHAFFFLFFLSFFAPDQLEKLVIIKNEYRRIG